MHIYILDMILYKHMHLCHTAKYLLNRYYILLYLHLSSLKTHYEMHLSTNILTFS